MALQQIKNFYTKYERPLSSLALLSGFVVDSLTLRRIDIFQNLYVLTHLIVAAIGIILLNIFENRKEQMSKKTASIVHFWLIIGVQYAFGAILSNYLIFYFRSAALVTGWPFLLLLALVLVSNELLKQRYTQLIFQSCVYFICIYSFAIFMIPLLAHSIGDGIFLLSGMASLAVFGLFLMCLRYIARDRFDRSRKILFPSIIGIFLLINFLYFFNFIPPLPLMLKDAGVYHTVSKDAEGNYGALAEEGKWTDMFSSYTPVHLVPGSPLYNYTAIFSPVSLNTKIIHDWQYYNESKKSWDSMSEVNLPIVGGRDDGFRTYSIKSNVQEGFWRVDVKTARGQLLGRIKFRVEHISNDELKLIDVDLK